MKILNIKFISIVLLSVFLYSCETEEVQTTVNATSTKRDILTFKTVDEFNETLAKVNAMTKTERKAWENERGFQSFGTINSEKYYSIDFSKYKSIDDIENDSEVLNYITIFKEDNATFIVPKETNNKERYLMNKDAMYIIGNTAVKYFDGKRVTTNISNIEFLKHTKDYDIALKGTDNLPTTLQKSPIHTEVNTDRVKIFYIYDNTNESTSTYKLRVHTAVYTYWIPSETRKQVFFIIQNYKKGFLGIYYLINYSTTFNYDIRTTDDNGNELDLLQTTRTQTIDSQDYHIDVPIEYGNTYDPDRNCTIYYYNFSVNNGHVSMSKTS